MSVVIDVFDTLVLFITPLSTFILGTTLVADGQATIGKEMLWAYFIRLLSCASAIVSCVWLFALSRDQLLLYVLAFMASPSLVLVVYVSRHTRYGRLASAYFFFTVLISFLALGLYLANGWLF